MKKFRVVVSLMVERIYEVDAENKEDARKIYSQFDDRTKFIKEDDCDYLDSEIEIEEAE